MIPSISLSGSDWLGYGKAISGIAESRSVQGCGSRPLFGKEEKKRYDECIARQQSLNAQALTVSSQNAQAQSSISAMNSQKTVWIVIAAVIVLIVLILILKR